MAGRAEITQELGPLETGGQRALTEQHKVYREELASRMQRYNQMPNQPLKVCCWGGAGGTLSKRQ